MQKYETAIPAVLDQISNVLSNLSGQCIKLITTGQWCIDENVKFSIELQETSIPDTIISQPNPAYPQVTPGYFIVNRIRLGTTILNDSANGCPFTEEEIKTVIKGNNIWGYYPATK